MKVATNIYPLILNLHPYVPVRFDMGAELKGVVIANDSTLSLNLSLPNGVNDFVPPHHVRSYLGNEYISGQFSILPAGREHGSEAAKLMVIGIEQL